MRIILAGPPAARARLRARMNGTNADIVGEFDTIAAARRSGLESDGILVPERGDSASGEGYEEPLTPREISVLELLAEGLSNRAIGNRLGISDQTVKFHVASILGKLGAANRTDAVRRAARGGLLAL